MTENEMRQLAEEWIEVWNSGDAQKIARLYTDDAVLYQAPLKKTLKGVEHIIARAQDFFSMSSDGAMTARAIHVEGDTIILELNAVGTHSGNFLDFEPTGRKYDLDACLVFEVRDNLIAKHTTYVDTATILRQLGLIEVPGTRAEAA